jgi:hypothetical protein
MAATSAFRLFGGKNIALKIPDHLYSETVRFYREVLKLPQIERDDGQVCFEFGETSGLTTLWIDRMTGTARPDVWLEIKTSDLEAARKLLLVEGATLPTHLEQLPDGFKGFWAFDPAGIVFLVSLDDE